MVDRIQKIIHQKKLSSSGFADLIGVPRSTISHLLSGRNNPSLDFIMKVLDAFPDVNTDWLIKGKGNMLYNEAQRLSNPSEFGALKEKPSQGLLFEDVKQPTKTSDFLRPSQVLPESLKNADAVATTDRIEKKDSTVFDKTGKDLPKPAIGTDENYTDLDIQKRRITKILFIYSDGTFSDYHPSQNI